MKTKILSLALSFLSVVAIAQKKEIRNAGKAVEKGSFAEAKTLLSQAEPQLSDANDNYTTDFYLYKGQAYLASGKGSSVQDLKTAAEAFQKAIEMGSEEAANGLNQVSNALVESAIEDQSSEKYKEGAEKLLASYDIGKDTLHLYYAATFYTQAKDYDTAIKYYEQLRDMGFTGVETQHVAINKATGEEEVMDKVQRDLMVKSGEYIKPQDRVTESKAGEIAKNIALIYIDQGEKEKAISAMDAAKAANPDDLTLLQSEADMYYQMDDKAKYKEIMEGILERDPSNPTLYYNLGVSSYEIGDVEGAVKYYNKALELNPEMTEARLNIAAAILSQEAGIVEQMNSLGLSNADTKKYDVLAAQRKDLYKEALPYLEKVMENNPENIEAIRTTMNIYYQIGENEKADALQAKLDEVQN